MVGMGMGENDSNTVPAATKRLQSPVERLFACRVVESDVDHGRLVLAEDDVGVQNFQWAVG